MEPDFYENFPVNIICFFFAFYSGLHDWIILKDLFTLHKLADKVFRER